MKKFSSEEEKREWEKERKRKQRDLSHPDVPPSKCPTFIVPPERIELTAELRKELGVRFKEEDGPFILDGIPKIDQIRKLAFLIHKKNGTQMKVNGKVFNGGLSELEAIV